MPKEKILDLIYWDREQEELSRKSEYEKEVISKIQLDNNEDKLRELIDSKIYNKKLCKKINNLLDYTLEDMAKMESATLDKYYKQGFRDGINLLIECLE